MSLVLLRAPINRYSQVCREFEQRVKKDFSEKSTTGFREGDMKEFIDTIKGYKTTTSVGLYYSVSYGTLSTSCFTDFSL